MDASLQNKFFFENAYAAPISSLFMTLKITRVSGENENKCSKIFIKMTIMHPFPHLFTFYGPKRSMVQRKNIFQLFFYFL
jgi:hypothetical protein